jgi:hypothetical protein
VLSMMYCVIRKKVDLVVGATELHPYSPRSKAKLPVVLSMMYCLIRKKVDLVVGATELHPAARRALSVKYCR